MQVIDIEKAKNSLGELVDAAVSGQEIILTKDARPVAKLVAVTDQRQSPRFGSAQGLIHISDDFDAPLPDFDEYMR